MTRRSSSSAESSLSLLLGLLIYVLGTSRSSAMQLVKERTDQLQHQALHDSLTGLPNRALILDRIDRMLARSRREHTDVAALFLDLDNFKDINDTLGHRAGDELLGQRRACDCKSAVRENDTVGRLGGDEFVVLADGVSLGGRCRRRGRPSARRHGDAVHHLGEQGAALGLGQHRYRRR